MNRLSCEGGALPVIMSIASPRETRARYTHARARVSLLEQTLLRLHTDTQDFPATGASHFNANAAGALNVAGRDPGGGCGKDVGEVFLLDRDHKEL